MPEIVATPLVALPMEPTGPGAGPSV